MCLIRDYLDATQKWQAERGPRTLVWFQVGLFYEVYALKRPTDEHYTGSAIADFRQIAEVVIVIKKNQQLQYHGEMWQIAFAGLPLKNHADALAKLQAQDYTVVIYNQDGVGGGGNGKNVKRQLYEIISPGTYFGVDLSTPVLSNHSMCVWLFESKPTRLMPQSEFHASVATVDILTGLPTLFDLKTSRHEWEGHEWEELERHIQLYAPKECLVVLDLVAPPPVNFLERLGLKTTKVHLIDFLKKGGQEDLFVCAQRANKQLYQQETFKKYYQGTLAWEDVPAAAQAFTLLLEFVQRHSPYLVQKLLKPRVEDPCDKLKLANHSLQQLNIIDGPSDTKVRLRSVSALLNHCLTNMGRRAFLYAIQHPVTARAMLQQSYDMTEYVLARPPLWAHWRRLLRPMTDVDKIWRKIVLRKVLPKELAFLLQDLRAGLLVHGTLKEDVKLSTYLPLANDQVQDLAAYLDQTFYFERLGHQDQDQQKDQDKDQHKDKDQDVDEGASADASADARAEATAEATEASAGAEDMEACIFIKPGLSETFDLLVQASYDNQDKLEAIRQYLSDLLKPLEEKNVSKSVKDFIKIHAAAKSDPILLGTQRRILLLKEQIKKKKASQVPLVYFSRYTRRNETFLFELAALDMAKAANKNDWFIKSAQINGLTSQILTNKLALQKEQAEVFQRILEEMVNTQSDVMRDFSTFLSAVDLLQNKCYVAHTYNYCKPTLLPDAMAGSSLPAGSLPAGSLPAGSLPAGSLLAGSLPAGSLPAGSLPAGSLQCTGLRHPLIQELQQEELYVTNDLSIGSVGPQPEREREREREQGHMQGHMHGHLQGLLLYGTNAVGKTSFIKAVGIALILAQTGMYVPCDTFAYRPYTAIFTRILGNDNLFKGLSTFAVEMSELRTILLQANQQSLVLGDELCAGTESDSALSIFTAGVEALARLGSTFLFATHFHEVSAYAEIKALPGVHLMHMAVQFDERTQVLQYDRKLRPGPGASMYGLEVCKAMRLPTEFLERAHAIRLKYATRLEQSVLLREPTRYNAQKLKGGLCEHCRERPSVDVHHFQHQQEANPLNGYIGGFHKNHVANLGNLCAECHVAVHQSGRQHKKVRLNAEMRVMDLNEWYRMNHTEWIIQKNWIKDFLR